MKPTQEQIDEQLNKCSDALDNGSKYPGMTYEEGVEAAIRWMIEEEDEAPMED